VLIELSDIFVASGIKTWLAVGLGISAPLFTALGALGVALVTQYRYRLDHAQAIALSTTVFFSMLFFGIGIVSSIIALQSFYHKSRKSIRGGFLVCIVLSTAGVGTMLLNTQLGVHSTVTVENICINNARRIESAKRDWAQRNGVTNGAVVTWEDIASYFKEGVPKCPENGTYNLGRAGDPVTCSIPSHRLPPQYQ